jgi:pilus assembly protein CpaB
VDEATIRALIARATAALGGRRRLLAAAFAAIAVVATVHAARPAPPRTSLVWTAAHDLNGAEPLAAGDLRPEAIPAALVPAGAIVTDQHVVGRLLAAPVRRGEPLTDVRLLGPALLSALPQPGLVAAPVRVVDGSATAALVHPGDLVDVLATRDADTVGAPPGGSVVRGAQVLAVPATDPAAGDSGGLVIVAVTPAQATALARVGATSRLTLTLERR